MRTIRVILNIAMMIIVVYIGKLLISGLAQAGYSYAAASLGLIVGATLLYFSAEIMKDE